MTFLTGYWESIETKRRLDHGSVKYLTPEQFAEQISERLNAAEPGTIFRIELIVWGEKELQS